MKKVEKVFFKYIINPKIEVTPEPTAVKRPANNTAKIFGAVDLWNIQRRKRITLIR
ncbi:MAG: hypothetical protein ABIN36_08020 [Ferruginibacter sp.]